MESDEYKTISDKKTGEGCYTEKRSKFLAFAHHAETAEQAKELATLYKKKYFDARHVCFAYMLGNERNEYRCNDDGEPSGTAGKPILGQINKNELTNIFIAVIRYFGGVKLGTGGLAVAYRTAASLAISDAITVTRHVEEKVDCLFPYEMLDSVMRVVKDMQPRIISQDYGNTCSMTLSIRKAEADKLRNRLENVLISKQ